MKLRQKRSLHSVRVLPAWLPAWLPALLLALLLCACGSQSQTPGVPGTDAALPVIGIGDLDPSAAVPGSTGAPAESKGNEPETTTAAAETTAAPETTVPEPETTAAETASPETTEAPASTKAPVTEAPTEPETTQAPATEAPTEPETTAPETTAENAAGVRVWMGDSRFVGIRDTVDYDREKDVFISAWGKGYDWMLETGFPEFEKLAAGKTIDIVYWSLGANDITNEPSDINLELAEKYAAQLNGLIARHPGVTFYLLSYGPVGEEGMDPNNIQDCAAYNKALRIFTDRVRELTGMAYIDQGEYLEQTGFRVYDGCHYDAATNRRAYEYVLSQSGQR